MVEDGHAVKYRYFVVRQVSDVHDDVTSQKEAFSIFCRSRNLIFLQVESMSMRSVSDVVIIEVHSRVVISLHSGFSQQLVVGDQPIVEHWIMFHQSR